MSAHGLHLIPHDSWLTTGSRWKLRGMAAFVGVAVFGGAAIADWLLFDAGVTPIGIMFGSDAVAAMLAALFSWKLMSEAHQRRELVQRQLTIIAETNHHIRNALELIQFSTQTTHNQEVINQVSTAVDRINWVLRELSGDAPSGGSLSPEDIEKHVDD